MTHGITLCRDCQHWHWSGTFNLDDYDRSRPPEEGWADGVCTVLIDNLSISCSGGWDGCTVDSVETDANFWCAFGKPRSDKTTPTMAEPSSAAQAVLDAANGASSWGPDDCLNDAREIAAAALRAAVEPGKLGPEHWEGSFPNEYEKGWNAALDYIMKIAAELEARQ